LTLPAIAGVATIAPALLLLLLRAGLAGITLCLTALPAVATTVGAGDAWVSGWRWARGAGAARSGRLRGASPEGPLWRASRMTRPPKPPSCACDAIGVSAVAAISIAPINRRVMIRFLRPARPSRSRDGPTGFGPGLRFAK
jgi:hypothetical protein